MYLVYIVVDPAGLVNGQDDETAPSAHLHNQAKKLENIRL